MSAHEHDINPHPIDLVRQLREALGLFAGAMPVSPREAWDEALAPPVPRGVGVTWPTPAPGRWQCTRVLGCIYNDTLGCLAYPSCPPDDPEDAADDADYPDDLFATVPKWWPENVDVKDELL